MPQMTKGSEAHKSFMEARNRITITVNGFNSAHQRTIGEMIKKALHRDGFDVLDYDALIDFVSPDDDPAYEEKLAAAKEKVTITMDTKS